MNRVQITAVLGAGLSFLAVFLPWINGLKYYVVRDEMNLPVYLTIYAVLAFPALIMALAHSGKPNQRYGIRFTIFAAVLAAFTVVVSVLIWVISDKVTGYSTPFIGQGLAIVGALLLGVAGLLKVPEKTITFSQAAPAAATAPDNSPPMAKDDLMTAPSEKTTLTRTEMEWLQNNLNTIAENQTEQIKTLRSINTAVQIVAVIIILTVIVSACGALL